MEYFNNYTVKYRAWDKERKIMAPVRSLLWSQDQMIVEVVRTDPFNQNSTFERFYDPVLMQHINDKDKDAIFMWATFLYIAHTKNRLK